jgi:hypothetical protein
MTKKIFLVLVLAAVFAGNASAQANVKNNWISGEASLVGGGATYERMLTQNFSVGLNAYWTSFFIIFNDLGLNAVGRWYPWGGSFYAELGAGFGQHPGVVTINGTADVGAVVGFDLVPGLGWKIDLGQPGGFFIEPLVQVPITLGVAKAAWWYGDNEFGAAVGFRAAFGLGYAF